MSSSSVPELLATVGASWTEIGEPLATMHNPRSPLRGTGVFAVRWGRTIRARLLAALLRLPRAGRRVQASLAIVPSRPETEWRRTFGNSTLRTTQSACEIGMRERFGPLELTFELHGAPGRLRFVQSAAAVRLGCLRLRLPRWLALRVRGRARNRPDGRVRAEVQVSAPLFGLVLTYEGDMRIEEGQ